MQPHFDQWADQIIQAIPTILTALVIFLVSIYRAGLQQQGIAIHKV